MARKYVYQVTITTQTKWTTCHDHICQEENMDMGMQQILKSTRYDRTITQHIKYKIRIQLT